MARNVDVKARRDDPARHAHHTKLLAESQADLKMTLGDPIDKTLQFYLDISQEELEQRFRRQNAIDLEYILDIRKEFDVSFDEAEKIYDRRNGT